MSSSSGMEAGSREGGRPEGGSRWTEVDDREELRRRLEELTQRRQLPPEEFDFVRFFFRASDPMLYPLAAMTLGRHAPEIPELAQWLERYAAARGLSLSDSIPLKGVRSHRRVLIALAAGRAAHPGRQSSWPLPPEVPRERPADLAIYLRALAILVGGRDGERANRTARAVVEELAGEPEVLVEGAGAERWAHLLQALQASDPGLDEGWARALWDRVAGAFRHRIESPGVMGMGRRLAYHRALAGLEWGLRDAGPDADGGPGAESDGLRRRLGSRLRLLNDPGAWWARSEAERAAAAFDLLDGSLRWPFSVTELHRLLDAFRLPTSRRAAGRVLLAISRRENVGAGELLDAPSLHTMDDPELLLELLPTEPPGELGAALADAVEHRIRMAMATDPDFDPSTYLARMEVKRPHPGFLQLLASVATDRDYLNVRGETVPLSSWLRDLQVELRATREGDAGTLLDGPRVPGALASLRARVRKGLAALDGEADPFAGATRLAALLDEPVESGGEPAGPGEPEGALGLSPGSHALTHLLGRMEDEWREESAAPLPRHADRGGGGPAGLGPETRLLRRGAEKLIPTRLGQLEEVGEAAEELQARLRALEDALVLRLPHPEAFLLSRALAGLRSGIGSWVEVLEGLERVRTRDPARWEPVFREAAAVDEPAFRLRLLPVVWRTLAGSGLGGGSGDMDLIEWAIQAGQELPPGAREIWLESVASQWSAMVEAGMEEGLETRVARLVRRPGARALAMLPGVDDTLTRTRTWFFDCYRLADAALATRALNLRRGEGSLVTLPRDLLAFFLHYSPVWLALLVGAILMLDFGDAWTAMAEIGDTRGILITFVVGLVGAFGYVAAELHSRVRDGPGERVWLNRARRLLRAGVFVTGALVYTLVVVGLLWWLLSGTDEVVHGAGAVLHVVVWSGFALFVGVFFGLMAKSS